MFDNNTDISVATTANLITILTGVMRKYGASTGSVPDEIAELEHNSGIETLAAVKLQAKLAYLG